MKTIEKKFDAVKFMRQQRDRLSKKLATMTEEEIIAYFEQTKLLSETKPCAQEFGMKAAKKKQN